MGSKGVQEHRLKTQTDVGYNSRSTWFWRNSLIPWSTRKSPSVKMVLSTFSLQVVTRIKGGKIYQNILLNPLCIEGIPHWLLSFLWFLFYRFLKKLWGIIQNPDVKEGKKKKHWEMTESRLNNISICWSIETGKNEQKLLRICENWHLSQYPTWMMELALCTCVWESTAYLVGFCGGTPHAGYWKWWWHCGQHWSDHSESIVPHLGATGFEKEPSYTITSLGTSPVWWVPWSMASDRGTLVWKVED